jgi:hypothetical protein
MSNLFLKNSIKNTNYNNSTESSFNLSNILNRYNNKTVNNINKESFDSNKYQTFSSTSQMGGEYDITSSAMIQSNMLPSYSSTSQFGGNFSVKNSNDVHSSTSSANMSKINSHDINNLLSMLTSESTDDLTEDTANSMSKHKGGNLNDSASSDNTALLQHKLNKLLKQKAGNLSLSTSESTEALEHKLNKLLKQNGGKMVTETESTEALEHKLNKLLKQNGGKMVTETESTEALEHKLQNLLKNNKKSKIIQKGGLKAILGLTGLGLAGVLAHKYTTETESESNTLNRVLGKEHKVPVPEPVAKPIIDTLIMEPPAAVMPIGQIPSKINNTTVVPVEIKLKITSDNNDTSESSTSVSNSKIGGAMLTETTTDISDSPTSVSDKHIQKGGRELSPGMKVFQDICKFISSTLEIPNGTIAKKIGGQLQRDVKEKNEDISADKLLDAVKQEFKQNKNKYESLKNKYIKEKDDKKKTK